LDAERERVVYVATTRARDLLVIPRAGAVDPRRFICGTLLVEAPAGLVRELPPYLPSAEPAWAREVPAPPPTPARDGAELREEVTRRWAAVATDAARPRFRPASVSGTVEPEEPSEAELATEPAKRKPHVGRYGALFGTTVHRAIGLVLVDFALPPGEAVRHAAAITGLTERLAEAAEDVARAVEALRREGLFRQPGPDLQLEYALAGAWDDGLLLSGYADLVAFTGDRLDVLDFKTDAPSAESVETAFTEYVAQVRAYGRLLKQAGVESHERRCGLLFTADGSIRWVES
jgi:ATP-dependent exoDNAse (exonuclease V) beta subunit